MLYSRKWVIQEIEFYGKILRYEVRTLSSIIPSTIYKFDPTLAGLNRARNRRDAMNGNAHVTRKVIE